MQALLYSLLGTILRFLHLQNIIILEAEAGTRENTQAVFHEMMRRGWGKQFQFVLVSDNPEALQKQNITHVTIEKRIQYGDSKAAMRRMRKIYVRSCLILDENRQLRKRDPKTIRVYLSHGSPVKSTHDYYNCKPDTDFALCQSEFWRPIESYQLRIPEEKLIIKGFPRNDDLFISQVCMADLFGTKYKKVIVWYPTFRQRETADCIQNTNSAAIPIIHA